jgi:Holliday junction resolvase RusA-like endonuclease
MIIIPLIPMAAPRPRFSKFGTYNDKKYTTYKQALLVSARSQDKSYFNGATKLEVTFYMPIPASLSKVKQKALNGEFHIKRPDTDNLLKSVKDSLNGIFYKDDSQICDVVAKKIYSTYPRTEIILKEIK